MSSEVKLKKDMMIVSETNKKGKIIYANKDFCKISGYSKNELIGMPHSIVRHPDMPSEAFRDLWDTLNRGKVWKGIVKNLCKNGDFYWVNATVYPVVKKDGKMKLISVRIKPTKKEIEKAKNLYKSMRG